MLKQSVTKAIANGPAALFVRGSGLVLIYYSTEVLLQCAELDVVDNKELATGGFSLSDKFVRAVSKLSNETKEFRLRVMPSTVGKLHASVEVGDRVIDTMELSRLSVNAATNVIQACKLLNNVQRNGVRVRLRESDLYTIACSTAMQLSSAGHGNYHYGPDNLAAVNNVVEQALSNTVDLPSFKITFNANVLRRSLTAGCQGYVNIVVAEGSEFYAVEIKRDGTALLFPNELNKKEQ
jgi:hypothetical protein